MFPKSHLVKRLSYCNTQASLPKAGLRFYLCSCFKQFSSFQRSTKSFKALTHTNTFNCAPFSSFQKSRHLNGEKQDLSFLTDLTDEQITASHQILEKYRSSEDANNLNSEEVASLSVLLEKLVHAHGTKNHLDKISQYLRRDLNLLKGTQNSSLIANVNHLLGVSYYDTNNFEKAEYHFKEACSGCKRLEETEEAKILMIKSQVALGIIYCRRNDAGKALEIFDSVVKKTSEAPEAYLGDTLIDIYQEIEKLYLSGCSGRRSKHLMARVQRPMVKALENAKKKSGEYSQKVFLLTSLLARSFAYQKKDNFARMNIGIQALPYAEKSLEIALKVFGEESIEVGQSYCLLANVYLINGDFEKSLELCRKAEEIFKKKGESCLDDLAEIYFILAKSYRMKEEYQKEALDFYSKAIEIKGEEGIRVAQMALEWAKLFQEDEKNMSESKVYLSKALDLYDKLEPSNKSQIAEIKLYLGRVIQNDGDSDKAFELFKESRSLLSMVSAVEGFRDSRSDLLLDILLGTAYLKQEFYYESKSCLSRAVRTIKVVEPNIVKIPGRLYFDLGRACEGLTLLPDAYFSYQEAANLNAASLGYDHPETIAAFEKIAELGKHLQEWQKGRE